MTKAAVVVLLLSACLHAADRLAVQTRPDIVTGRNEARASRFWKFSMAALAGANAFDVSSSWGKRELNGMLQSRNGTFGPHGLGVKLGFQGAFMGIEALVLRHDSHGTRHRIASWINLGAGAAIAAVAARNSGIPRQ